MRTSLGPTHRGPDLGTAEVLRRLSVVEEDTPTTLTRRRVLQAAGAIGAGAAMAGLLPSLVPGWAGAAFGATPLGPDDGVLVVLLMGGGNDALNMVVPYGSGDYYARRPRIGIAPGQVLPLDGATGLHPNLTFLHSMYQQGKVAVVQGVGTSTPDLSHFVSMASWMRGWLGGGTAPTTGWIGRWLDAIGADPFHAIQLGSSVPLHLVGATRKASALTGSAPFGTNTEPYWGELHDAIRAYGDQPTGLGPWSDAIAASQRSHLSLASAVGGLYAPALPTGRLLPNMTLAARLINADLGTRVLSMGWGDFDGHDGARAMHDARMAELDQALAAFWSTLSPQWANRVTIMTFSEFGRRLPDNANGGVDHGTAAAQLVIGPQVRGGLHGTAPSLRTADLWRGDYPVATVHHGEYLATVLQQWLGADPQSILGSNPSQLSLFASGPSGPPPLDPGGPTAPGDLVALSPSRQLDTRTGLGAARQGPLGPGERVDVTIAGTGGVPGSGALAAVMNVTAVVPTAGGYLTVWPAGEAQPGSSNVNFGPGDVVPNLVVCKIGAAGRVSIVNAAGETDVVADVVGYVRTGTSTTFVPVQPTRLLDTRSSKAVGAGGDIALTVTGGSIPSSGVQSVVLNVTVNAPTRDSFLTVYPNGDERPWTSNLNFRSGQTVPNLVVARVGDGGKVRFYNTAGSTHVIVDLLGYTMPSSTPNGHVVAVTPARVLDTRIPGFGGPLAGGEERRVGLRGIGGLPDGPFSGVIANVTVTEPTDVGYLTVWPAGLERPTASNLNFGPGQTVPNLVVSAVGADGGINVFAPFGSTHVIVDVVGYVT